MTKIVSFETRLNASDGNAIFFIAIHLFSPHQTVFGGKEQHLDKGTGGVVWMANVSDCSGIFIIHNPIWNVISMTHGGYPWKHMFHRYGTVDSLVIRGKESSCTNNIFFGKGKFTSRSYR